ncbi:hypothetical protein BDB01DRAFT_725441 [Pilobolus umbonatus]|nr:hypothetical protein BDB01DRAFT_725441 [Pilobolus umbonatus]
MATNTTQSKESTAPQLASQDVGLIFVREYYTFLNKRPDRLHAFYSKDSIFIRGDEGTMAETIRGQKDIKKKIEECKFEDCKVLVTQVDSQTSANNGILIQVLGEMCNQNGPSQKFSQTFFLAPQPRGYYVLNDIFRFLKDEVEIDYYTCEEDEAKKVEPIPSAHTSTTLPVNNKEEVKEEEVKEEIRSVKEEEEAKKVLKEDVTPTVSDEVKKTEVTAVKPDPVESTPTPVEEKKKRYENKQHKQQKEQQKQESSTQQSSPQQPRVDKPVHVNNKSSAPKTWANLTAAAPVVNGVAHPEKPATPIPTATNVPVSPAPAATEKPSTTTQTVNKTPTGRKDVTQIFVKLVNELIGDEQLKEAFSQFGIVKNVNINRQKNCAFVEFATTEACQKALNIHKVTVGNHIVLAEERRFNNSSGNRFNNPNNQNRSQNTSTNTFERRPNNHRRGGSTPRTNTAGKGRGASTPVASSK